VYRATPEVMGHYALDVYKAGARIVGACCGSSPDHIRAMATTLHNPQALEQHAIATAQTETAPKNGAATTDRAARRAAREARKKENGD
jgi:hypothetical protein